MAKEEHTLLRRVIALITAFILALLLTGSSVVAVVAAGPFNASLWRHAAEQDDYITELNTYITEHAQMLAIPEGLTDEVFDGVFTNDRIREDTRRYIDAVFAGETYTADTSALQNTLQTNILTYFADADITLSEEQQENVVAFARGIARDYEENIHIPLLDRLAAVRNRIAPYLWIALGGTVVLAAVAVWLIFRLFGRDGRATALRYCMYSTVSASLILGIPTVCAFVSRVYARISLSPKYFYLLVVELLRESLWIALAAALLWVVVSIAGITVRLLMQRHGKKKNHS